MRECSPKHCTVVLPDGSCSSITLRPGASIREVLQDLCQNISVNIAAVDLFLVGGEKVRDADIVDKRLLNVPVTRTPLEVETTLCLFQIKLVKSSVTTTASLLCFILFETARIYCLLIFSIMFFMVTIFSSQPLVLDQDCLTLSSRELRVEKRTLFRY